MGAVANKIHEPVSTTRTTASEESAVDAGIGAALPRRPQLMELLALTFALPGALAMALATSLLGMWAVNGGNETAWGILTLLWVGYAGVGLPVIAASMADR